MPKENIKNNVANLLALAQGCVEFSQNLDKYQEALFFIEKAKSYLGGKDDIISDVQPIVELYLFKLHKELQENGRDIAHVEVCETHLSRLLPYINNKDHSIINKKFAAHLFQEIFKLNRKYLVTTYDRSVLLIKKSMKSFNALKKASELQPKNESYKKTLLSFSKIVHIKFSHSFKNYEDIDSFSNKDKMNYYHLHLNILNELNENYSKDEARISRRLSILYWEEKKDAVNSSDRINYSEKAYLFTKKAYGLVPDDNRDQYLRCCHAYATDLKSTNNLEKAFELYQHIIALCQDNNNYMTKEVLSHVYTEIAAIYLRTPIVSENHPLETRLENLKNAERHLRDSVRLHETPSSYHLLITILVTIARLYEKYPQIFDVDAKSIEHIYKEAYAYAIAHDTEIKYAAIGIQLADFLEKIGNLQQEFYYRQKSFNVFVKLAGEAKLLDHEIGIEIRRAEDSIAATYNESPNKQMLDASNQLKNINSTLYKLLPRKRTNTHDFQSKNRFLFFDPSPKKSGKLQISSNQKRKNGPDDLNNNKGTKKLRT